MSSPDLVTILFTDWVGSTDTRVRLGEERADQLQHVHDELLRDAIAEHRGTLVKGSGDGVFATFDSATDALAASVTIQQRFDDYGRRRDAIAPVQLRIGISVGDVVHQDGDLFGTPIIEAKRLEEVAGTGQILCSELVRMLARGRGGFDFEVIGLLDLKGLPEPVAACAVGWDRTAVDARLPLPPELALDLASGFVGRSDELARAIDLVEGAEHVAGLWVLGEAGIGKTRLAGEVAARAHASGALVLFGRCDEHVTTPFQPFIQALRWFADHFDDDGLADQLGADPQPLARLVPELRTRVPGLAGDATDAADQFRLFESVRSWLTTISREVPTVLVVDDVHWADPGSLAVLGQVLRSADTSRLLVIATARDTEPDSSQELADIVDDLDRLGRNLRLDLGGLSTAEVSALVRAAGVEDPDGDDRIAADLTQRTAGNPLFVRAVVAGWRGGDDAAVPTDVRVAVRRRVRGLAEDGRALLQVAAVAGLEFELTTLLVATATDEPTGLDLIEEAVSAGLVEELSVDRFRFTHALVRDAMAEELSVSRRARLHEAIARVLESRAGGPRDDDLHSIAHHYARAGSRRAMLERALEFARSSARRAVEMLALDVAIADYDLALDLARRLGDPDPAMLIDLLVDKGEAQRRHRAHSEAMTTLHEALGLARDVGDWHRYGRAAVAFEEAVWRPGFALSGASRHLAVANDHTDEMPAPLAIRVRASYGRALHFDGDPEESRRLATAALDDARRVGDDAALAHTLLAWVQAHQLLSQSASTEERDLVSARVHEAWDLMGPSDDPETRHAITWYGVGDAVARGDRAAMLLWHRRSADLAHPGALFRQYVHTMNRQNLAFIDGDLEAAERLAEECAAVAEGLHEDLSSVYGGLIFLIRREQDQLRPMRKLLERVLDANAESSLWQPGLVWLLAEAGLEDEARRRLVALTAERCRALPRDDLFGPILTFLCEAAAVLHETSVADDLEAVLASVASVSTIHLGFGYLGPAPRFKGLAAGLRDPARAADLFDQAARFDRRLVAPLSLAHNLTDGAIARRLAGDSDGAAARAKEAATIAERLGLAAVRRQLDEAGLTATT